MTVTKNELANHLWETMGWTHKEAVQMVDAFFDQLRAAIVADSELLLSNFGRFAVRDKGHLGRAVIHKPDSPMWLRRGGW